MSPSGILPACTNSVSWEAQVRRRDRTLIPARACSRCRFEMPGKLLEEALERNEAHMSFMDGYAQYLCSPVNEKRAKLTAFRPSRLQAAAADQPLQTTDRKEPQLNGIPLTFRSYRAKDLQQAAS